MNSNKKLFIFETHPIQYRAPVYQEMERIRPGTFEVIYASDFSVSGYKDKDFGTKLSWDTPLLSGYKYRILKNKVKLGIAHWSGLNGNGIDALIAEENPHAILLHSFGYKFNWAAYWAALWRRIPIWIRIETQDEAVERGFIKSLIRSLVYRIIYLGVSKAFYIGVLNREHLLRHGIRNDQVHPSLYCTPDPIGKIPAEEKIVLKNILLEKLKIPENHKVISFFGKFISKKNPEIILRALQKLSSKIDHNITCLYVGSGELELCLREQAKLLESSHGIKTIFAGFINQSHISSYYLASDIVVLPSRRSGETWGLVVNEALQAGCAVVLSEAVGCHRNFGDWERVRTIPVGDDKKLCLVLCELLKYQRDFLWASEKMYEYSITAAALNIHDVLGGSRRND